MRKITLDELREMAQAAKGYIDKIYVHWSAGRYHQFFDDYHINVDADGSIYASTEDLTELLAHTWHRNSRAVGICMAGCYGAEAHSGYNTDFGDYPPTQDQIDGVAKVVAVLCEELDLPIDYAHVKTHCEAAEEDDYGPSTTCERWDLWYLLDAPLTDELKLGGQVIRGKAAWWQKNI
jgi:hypothetical protein|nr:MAG TPA: N-acetylmuramoyl-L-alanine amidase [Caudoviricetes sp.]